MGRGTWGGQWHKSLCIGAVELYQEEYTNFHTGLATLCTNMGRSKQDTEELVEEEHLGNEQQ